MAKKILTDLSLRISANSAQLQKGLDKAKGSMNKFKKSSQAATKQMQSGFKQMGGVVTRQMGIMGGVFGQLGGAMKTAFRIGVAGVNSFKMALISTGIGAIVVALGAAVGALISYFKNTKSGADKFNKAMSGIKAVITTLMHRVNLLGEAVSLVMEGKFKQAAAKAKEAFTGLGKEIKENYEKGRDYAERENALKARKNAFIVREATLMRDVKKLREIADDKTKSIAEREAAITKAIEKNAIVAKEKIGILKEENDLLIAKNALGDNTYEDDQAEQEGKAEILRIEEQMYKKQAGLKNLQEQITSDSLKEQKALSSNLEKLNKIKTVKEEIVDLDTSIDFSIEGDQQPDIINYDKLMEAMPLLNQIKLGLKVAGNEGKLFSNIFAGMNNIISDSLKSTDNVFKAFGKSFLDMIKGMIIKVASLTAAMLALAVAIQLTGLGGLLGITKGATIGKTIGNIFTKVNPFKMASGGLAYGETLATVGEYAGAANNPEVIAPLSDLKNIIGGMGMGNLRLTAVVTGNDLKFILDETNRIQGNSF